MARLFGKKFEDEEESTFKKKTFGKKYEDDEDERPFKKKKFEDDEEDERGAFKKKKGLFSKSEREAKDSNLSKAESYDFVHAALTVSNDKKTDIIIPGKTKSLMILSVINDKGGRAKIPTVKRYGINEPESSVTIFKAVRQIMKNTEIQAEDFAKHIYASEKAILADFQNDFDSAEEYYADGVDIGGLICLPYINADEQLAFKYEVVQKICQYIKDDSAF